MDRRFFLTMCGVISVCTVPPVEAEQDMSKKTLLSAPLELGDGWVWSSPEEVKCVLSRVRDVCLSGLRLLSDRQPDKLQVDNLADYTKGWPHIWLHADQPGMAWIFLNVPSRDWSQLARQFGHEFGHVFCNSWDWDSSAASGPPAPPGLSRRYRHSHWLEEALVEAFTIRGLGLLASSWEKNPPFADDQAFAATIREHRADRLKMYNKEGDQDIASWFRDHRSELESGSADKDLAVVKILPILEDERACVEDLGAVNRWPARTRNPDRGISCELGDKLH